MITRFPLRFHPFTLKPNGVKYLNPGKTRIPSILHPRNSEYKISRILKYLNETLPAQV